jgi:hypothetical protein
MLNKTLSAKMNFVIIITVFAGIAQSVEQLIRNEKVVGSIPISGTILNNINQYIVLGYCAFNHRLLNHATDQCSWRNARGFKHRWE